MNMPNPVRLALVVATSIGLTACASTAGGDEPAAGGAGAVAFAVDNDVSPPSSITVYLVPESGGRQRLGTVNANGRQTFSHSPFSPSMQFYLLAEVVGESDVRSESFNLVGATRLEWSVSRRQVRIVR